MDGLIDIPPEEDPENMPTATEELLQIMEDFADYIDKFMFEIVTLLAVVDSAMGLIKDVLGLFGFEGWKMAFFPTFSFIVTTGVFLFGAKKRKGKRDAPEAPEGLAEAFEAIEDVMEVVEDVAEGLEEIENEGGGDDGDLGNVLGDVVGSSVSLPIEAVAGEMQGTGDGVENEGQQGDANTDNTPADGNQNIARKVIAVAVLAAGIISKLKKKRGGGQEDDPPTKEAGDGGEGSSRDVEKQEAGIGSKTPQGSSQESERQSATTSAITGASAFIPDNHKPLASTTCGFNESVIIDLNLADHGKTIAERDWQNAAKNNVIAAERQLRWNSRKIARGVEQGSSEIKREIEGTTHRIYDSSRVITHIDEENQNSEKLLNKSSLEMASGIAKNTTDLAGSAAKGADQQARKGIEETKKKSGSMLHIAIRLVRLIVRVVNKKKGGSSADSQKSEESTEKAASTDIIGSTASLESDSVYFDCLSSTPKQTQRFGPTYASCKSLTSTSTQTDRDNIQPQYRSEPQLLYRDSMGMFSHESRVSPWDNLRRSVLSMPNTALMEIRDAANEEMRFREAPNEQIKKITETVELRPAWLGSRDEMAGRLSREVRRANETLLDIASPYLRVEEPGPSYDGYARVPQTNHLDAPVILHRTKDSNALRKFQKSGIPATLHERAKTQSTLDSFKDAERSATGEEVVNPGNAGRGVAAVWDRDKSSGGSNRYSNNTSDGNKGQSAPDNRANNAMGLDDPAAESFAQPGSSDVGFQDRGKGPTEWKGQRSPEDWEGPNHDEERRYEKAVRSERGVRDRGKNPRERNIRSSSSYEGLEEYEDGRQGDRFSRANNSKRLTGSQRSIDSRPRNLRHSVPYELTEDDSVFEEEDFHQDGNWRSERSGSNTRLASKSDRGRHPSDVSSSKPRHPSRLTSLEDGRYEVAYFSKPSAMHSPILPSESSGSVESARSQRRSNVSLSSVRFADEEPSAGPRSGRVSRNNSKRENNAENFTSHQSIKQSGPRESRRKIAPNGRWNSAVCLTGHQKAKMSLPSTEPYMNDHYISDESGSPRVRHGTRTRINRGSSFNRLSRGPSTIIRTRSANYLGDDESDERA